jgi:hypothetical protein
VTCINAEKLKSGGNILNINLHLYVDYGRNMYKVETDIKIIGINPFIFLPDDVLNGLFK